MIEYNDKKHEYKLDGKKLISTTQLMAKHNLAPDYSGVDEQVLSEKAKYGTFVHGEIEEYLKTGVVGFSDEVNLFVDELKKSGLQVDSFEQIVYNDVVAGKYDLCLTDGTNKIMVDHKTTYELHISRVKIQVSIYVYLKTKANKEEYKTWKGRVNWFHKLDGKITLEVVNFDLIAFEFIEKLIECERKGEMFTYDVVPMQTIMEVYDLESYIIDMQNRIKEAESKKAEFNKAIMKAMNEQGISKFETDLLIFNNITEKDTKVFDKDEFEKDYPDLYQEYKTKDKKGRNYLKITVKK